MIQIGGQTFTDKETYYLQLIRLIDVLFIGPVMIYAATFKSLPNYLRLTLFILGLATIAYNGKNYLKTMK